MVQVTPGDRVRVAYRILLEDGRVIGESAKDEPLEFVVGERSSFAFLTAAIEQLDVGERRQVTVPPEEGFGPRDPTLVWSVARSGVPADAKVGGRLNALIDAAERAVWIAGIDADQVTLDGNHPLAGHTLNFDIQLLEHRPHADDATNGS